MDLTPSLGLNHLSRPPGEALAVLSRQHPGLRQDPDGTFVYGGYRFNHFLSGVPMDPSQPCSYMLVDADDRSLWLFTYGNPEERWADYVELKRRQQERRQRGGLFGWFRGLFRP
jgi:hypothetical protein